VHPTPDENLLAEDVGQILRTGRGGRGRAPAVSRRTGAVTAISPPASPSPFTISFRSMKQLLPSFIKTPSTTTSSPRITLPLAASTSPAAATLQVRA
jgi:hypothetical protein